MFKTILTLQPRIISPKPVLLERAKAAVLETLKLKNLDIQPDLLYFETILVTEGFNDNDDVFLREELKAALKTPILKPINWQHNEKDIMGVIYHIEARDLNGKAIAEISDEPFEIAIEGAIWHLLPHLREKSELVKARIDKGDLFSSMECWFTDYDYAFQKESASEIEVVSKDKNDYVEGLLKINGGAGKLDKYRVGRALRNIVFGGMGLVDKPANKRSEILSVLDGYREQVNNSFAKDDSTIKEDLPMTNQLAASASASNPDNTEVIVKKILNEAERDKDYALARDNVKRLEAELQAANDKVTALNQTVDKMSKDLDTALAAMFDKAVPAEIALIDNATDKFAAKLAFLQNSRKANASIVNEDEMKALKAENLKLRGSIREAEIKELDLFTQEELAQRVTYAQSLDEQSYVQWLDEKKSLAKKVKELREKAKLVPVDGPEKLGGDGSELKRMGKGPGSVPLRTLAEADLAELFTEVKEPDLGDADAGTADNDNSMQTMADSLFQSARRKEVKKVN